ncbi:hypothetical protein [Variovorax paradoxus]|uniref:hypothetical protein n=1 Tax=Variovorax paradoxus TaxID=34073 RepID=UPI001934A4A9|nr:hypothetical protein INQ48_41125 [Variovorax paradoxus]
MGYGGWDEGGQSLGKARRSGLEKTAVATLESAAGKSVSRPKKAAICRVNNNRCRPKFPDFIFIRISGTKISNVAVLTREGCTVFSLQRPALKTDEKLN